MKSYFPDVNVWLALAYRGHLHHSIAKKWFEKLDSEQAIFCRITELALLRLLTNPAAMKDEVKSEREAWRVYDEFRRDDRTSFYAEPDPDRIDAALRSLTTTGRFAHQQWPDAYLAAFAESADLRLVTFDRGLSRSAGDECLLLPTS